MTATNIVETDPYFRFLTKFLKTGDLLAIPLAGDASARRYFRIVKGSESFVLMSWEPFESEDKYPFLNVQKHLKKHKVQVPEVLSVSKEEGFVLLEDLGDLTLERKFWESQNPEVIIPFYRDAIDEIVKVHYPATKDREQTCLAFHIEFNTERLLWEMNYAREHLLEKFLGFRFNDKGSKILDNSFHDICRNLHEEPKYIAHRDYHSRNLMIKFGRMRVIDFQDARLGPVQYDLVSLLRDSYVDLSDALATSLLDYYTLRRIEQGEKPVSREQFNRVYELQSIQRCLKACGSFSSFFNSRQDRRYLKYIRPTLNRVRKALLIFPEYKELYGLLSDQGLFENEIPAPL